MDTFNLQTNYLNEAMLLSFVVLSVQSLVFLWQVDRPRRNDAVTDGFFIREMAAFCRLVPEPACFGFR